MILTPITRKPGAVRCRIGPDRVPQGLEEDSSPNTRSFFAPGRHCEKEEEYLHQRAVIFICQASRNGYTRSIRSQTAESSPLSLGPGVYIYRLIMAVVP